MGTYFYSTSYLSNNYRNFRTQSELPLPTFQLHLGWGGVGSVYVCMCVHVANISLTPGWGVLCMCVYMWCRSSGTISFETACSQDSLTRCGWLVCGFPGSFGLCLPSTKKLVCTTMPGFSDGRSRRDSGPYISTQVLTLVRREFYYTHPNTPFNFPKSGKKIR